MNYSTSIDICNEIAKKLWSIMPSDAKEIYYVAAFHNWGTAAGIDNWLLDDGTYGCYEDYQSRPESIEFEINDLVKQMRKMAEFKHDIWSDVRITLNNSGRITLDFAYIPDFDSKPNLYMNGISDLSYLEAYDRHGVPIIDWLATAKKSLKFKNDKIAHAISSGQENLVRDIEAQVLSLRSRIDDANSRLRQK